MDADATDPTDQLARCPPADPEVDAKRAALREVTSGLVPEPFMLELSREISEQVSNIPVITRANVYAYKPGCILDLKPYMPAGDERFNDVHIGAACR